MLDVNTIVQEKRSCNARTWIGIILVFLGSIFIIDNLNILPIDLTDTIFHWPIILLVIGLVMLFNSKDKFLGSILVFLGTYFLIDDYINYSLGELIADYWPVALIILGLYILYKRGDRENLSIAGDSTKSLNADSIDDTAVFSSAYKIITSKNFKGGKITAVFAGPKYDFRDCELAGGKQALDIMAVFGGIEFQIPDHWNIVINVKSIFGGFEDSRKFINKREGESTSTLIINGFVIFGGGEIKR